MTLSVMSCAQYLFPRDNDHFVASTKQGLSVYATGDALRQDVTNGYIPHFAKDVEAYIGDLLIDLYVSDAEIRRCEFFTDTNDFLSHIDVIIDATASLGSRALYDPPMTIILTDDYAMESLLGHELVRVLLFNCGHGDEALEMSITGWTGLRGEMWNIAETDSLKYIDDPIR